MRGCGNVGAISLEGLVRAFAQAFARADARAPVWTSSRGRVYQAGLGPHAEDAAVALVLEELVEDPSWAGVACGQFIDYPSGGAQVCDMWVGEPTEWVVEVKMARLRGDNGKPDDMTIKKVISPYARDHSAVTDAAKLAQSGFSAEKAIIIYGFDYPNQSVDPLIAAFETLASRAVELGPRCEADLGPLVHPVHTAGRVFGWQIGSSRATRSVRVEAAQT
jgi:hypothetical protein